MAFTQSTFASVATNSTLAQALYSYKTADDTATVTATGYFDTKKLQLNEKDQILCKLSDGVVIVQIGADTSTGSVVIGGATFCASPTYTPTVIAGGQTTNIVGNNITGINNASTVGNNTPVVVDSAFGFTSQSSIVHIETTFQAQTGTGNSFILGFISASPITGISDVLCGLVMDPSTGVIFDALGASPVGVVSVMAPGVYTASLDLNTATSTVTFKDNNANTSPLSVTLSPAYNNLNPTYAGFGANAGDTLGDEITQTANIGDSAFVISTVGAVSYCDA